MSKPVMLKFANLFLGVSLLSVFTVTFVSASEEDPERILRLYRSKKETRKLDFNDYQKKVGCHISQDLGTKILKKMTTQEKLGVKRIDLNIGTDFQNEVFTAVPDFIKEFPNMEELDLRHHAIQELPSWLFELKKLKTLYLGFNQIKSLPRSIQAAQSLRVLELANNSITEIPKEIGKLSDLRSLDISFNPILKLPIEFGSLSRLEILNLSGTQVLSLPNSFQKLSQLRHLDPNEYLDVNRLKSSFPKLVVLNRN